MRQPSLDILLKKVDSKYTLVVAAAKRARALTEGEKKLVDTDATKPVTVALEEIAAGKIKYERTKSGIK
ncbi:MAG: DNA-directed polymerase subunit omega [Eubacteriales bacterium]|nr:DNA-directed polymerase subunit omega [Eubacteriales bacterium]MDN5363655.1 DNA-directed polymerase subunit omega [Eubacteriales bacterium]